MSITYMTATVSISSSGPKLQVAVLVMEDEHYSHCFVFITLFTFILSLH